MAQIGRWTGGVIGSLNPSETWAAPNGMFPTQSRNDASAYTFTSSTSTLTLPSSGLADGYLMLAHFEYEDSSNGRFNPQGRIIQSGGTGTFAGQQTGGYSRDNSEDRAWVRCWAFVDNPSASATFQFQWKRDSDNANTSDGIVQSAFEVIPFYYADIGIYSSTTTGNYGGTTINQVTGFSGTDGTNITIASNVVSVTGDNKRYLIFGGYFMEDHSGGTRTQRWAGLEIDGSKEDAAKAYAYYRQASDDELGMGFAWIIETVTATRTIEMFAYRGDGVLAGQGGASSDGTGTESNAAHNLVVIELNDSAEVFQTVDETGNTEIALTGPVDLNVCRTTDINFNDSASWTRASDTAMNAEVAMDALLWANVGAAQETVSTGSRFSCRAHITVNGTEDANTRHGNYQRNNQTSADTFGWSANPCGVVALSLGDDVGVSCQELAGTEGGGGNVEIQAGWAGFIGINLDTLEAGGETIPASASDGVEMTDSVTGEIKLTGASTDGVELGDTPTAVLKAKATATDGIEMTDTPAADFAHDFRLSLSTQFVDGAATTYQLTAPSGKSTTDFDAGKIHESSNPADSINITADDYTEIEFCFKATADAADVQYDFRIEGLDTYTVTPQLTISSAIQASVSDGISMGETLTTVAKLVASITDGMNFSESQQSIADLVASITDGAEMSESLTTAANLLASASDGVEMAETLARLKKLFATATDGIEGTDTPSAIADLTASASDGVDFSETLTRVLTMVVTASDGLELAEAVSILKKLTGSATDGAEFSETLSVIGDLLATATDGVVMAETVTGDVSGVLEAVASDGLQMTDTPTVVATWDIDVSDGMTLSEAFVITLTAIANASDGVELSEAVSAIISGAPPITASAADGIEIGDTPQAVATLLITVLSGVELSESLSRSKILSDLAADGFKIGDTGAANLKFEVTCADGVKMAETLSRVLRLAAVATDGFTVGEITAWEIAAGMVSVTFTAKGATVTFSMKTPSISWTGKKPKATMSGKTPAAGFTGKKPKITLQ